MANSFQRWGNRVGPDDIKAGGRRADDPGPQRRSDRRSRWHGDRGHARRPERAGDENKSAKGGYILLEAEGGERKLTILSTGSELHLAVEARDILQKEGIPTAVVSVPCRLLFEQQDAAYKKAVLGTTRAPE